MRTFRIIMASLVITCISASCIKENTPPAIPPEGSMVMKIDGFWNGNLKSFTLPNSNFLFAAGHVFWWNTVLIMNLAIPAATFVESFNHDPVWNGASREWIWTYSVTVGSDDYTAELHGKISFTQVNWSMYISKTGGFSSFLWFTGTSRIDNASGTWNLNRSPEIPTEFLRIDWVQETGGTVKITYLNVIPEAAENGSYITFGTTGEPLLNAFYDIYGKAEDRLINIKWDTVSHAGRVKAPEHFMDPEWHCWDDQFLNADCR